ncbi:MAG: nitroreductase family deazaflavin-dependent oxidoreductase [Candidatus Binatia bacterium]
MAPRNESVFVGELTTVGRKTGLPRTVEIRMVYLDRKFYACSSNVQGKHWCRNMLKNQAVEVRAGKERFRCKSRRVTEEPLRMRVLNLRDSRPLAERVVFELAPEG